MVRDHPTKKGCRNSAIGSMTMTTWEYLTAPLIVHNTKAILDNFGADGWELVQVVQGPGGGLVAYFKRPKE